MRSFLLAALRVYRRWISPALPASCRFEPTCSAYAMTAIKRHGVLKGTMLTAGRLARCHPFHPGGYDPVPELDRETEKLRNGETEIQTAV